MTALQQFFVSGVLQEAQEVQVRAAKDEAKDVSEGAPLIESTGVEEKAEIIADSFMDSAPEKMISKEELFLKEQTQTAPLMEDITKVTSEQTIEEISYEKANIIKRATPDTDQTIETPRSLHLEFKKPLEYEFTRIEEAGADIHHVPTSASPQVLPLADLSLDTHDDQSE
ncbi:hypothetical protein GN956_G17517 [Arapaima gigas]